MTDPSGPPVREPPGPVPWRQTVSEAVPERAWESEPVSPDAAAAQLDLPASAAYLPASSSVPDGPVSYRRRLRRYGPFAGLGVGLSTGLLSALIWVAWPCSGRTCVATSLAGWVLAIFAVPTALALGFPLTVSLPRFLVALVTSAAVWMLLGAWAGRRATRSAVAAWRDWVREFAWMAGGLWAGLVGGIGLVAWILLHFG